MSILYRTAGCSPFGDWVWEKGYNISKSKWNEVKYGDLVLFEWNGNGHSDHIGFVEKVYDNYIITIEGNTSLDSNANGGCVMRRTRYKSDVNYFARIPVDMTPIMETAKNEIGTHDNPVGNVKYNTWYYGKKVKGSAYAWCMVFVQWCFEHPTKVEPKVETKPQIKVDGVWGRETTKQTQRVLGCTVDGIKGVKTIRAIQKRVGTTQDGIWGVKTTKAMQKFVGTKQDGILGKKTIKAWQKWLNKVI